MNFYIFWIIVGVVAGLLAGMVVPSNRQGGIVSDLVIGIIGAFIGGYLFKVVLGHSYSGWVGSTGVAFVGAVVLLIVLRALNSGRRSSL